MALLDTLAAELMGPKSVKELSKNTDASPDQIRKALTAALPLLVSGMYQNSGTEEGARSLEKALDQHAPKARTSTSAMLREADAEDGKKILGHVLGTSEDEIAEGISRASGMDKGQTLKLLALLAPVVLALMGNFKQEQQPQQTQESQNVSGGLTGLLGSALLGNAFQQVQPAQQSGLNLSNLAGALLGGSAQAQPVQQVQPVQQIQQTQSSSGGLGSLLGGLFGGGSSAAQTQTQSSGPDLSGLLMSLLK